MSRVSNRIAIAGVALVLTAGSFAAPLAAHATVPASFRCAVAKRKVAIKRLRAIDACYALPPTATPTPPDPACLAKADQEFQRAIARIEARGGCMPATGDATTVSHAVDQCETALIGALPGMCLDSGTACFASGLPCCSGFCIGVIGQPAVCG